MKSAIEPASLSTVTYIAAHLRDSDLEEFRAVFGPDRPVVETLLTIADRSGPWAYTAKSDGDPIALFGVLISPDTPHLGLAWGFGTRRTRRVIPTVTKFIRSELIPALLSNGVNRVEVRVIDTSHDAIRWLGLMLGAQYETHLPECGAQGETFLQFSWTRGNF